MDQLIGSVPPWLVAGVITIGLLLGAIFRGWNSGGKDIKSGEAGGGFFKVKGPAVVDQGSIVSGALAASVEGLSATLTLEIKPALDKIYGAIDKNSEGLETLNDSLKETGHEIDRLREEVRISREVMK